MGKDILSLVLRKFDEAILDRKSRSASAKCCCSCWHFWSDTTDIKYGFMSLSKIGLVKITCHESLHSSHVCMAAAAAAVDPLCCLHFQLLHNFRRQKAKVKLSSLDSSGHARVILGKNENFRLLSKVFNWRKRRENLLMSNQILVKRKDSSSLSINIIR